LIESSGSRCRWRFVALSYLFFFFFYSSALGFPAKVVLLAKRVVIRSFVLFSGITSRFRLGGRLAASRNFLIGLVSQVALLVGRLKAKT